MNQPSNKLLCPENQILLDYLLKEHIRAPYTGRGPYYAAALRKVISSVTECAFPLRTLEQMSSLHGAGKVLSQKLWEIHNSTSGEGVASQPASMRTANLPVDKRARSSEYRPERGKGPWWTLHALHGLNGSGTKSEVQGYISRIQHELTDLVCPPIADWWNNAIKTLQGKLLIERGDGGGRSSRYLLTAEGSRIAEGLDEPRKVSSRHQEDAVEAAFSEICRDRKAAHDSTMDIRVESRLNTQARNLISLVSDSDDDMVEEREASADCLSQVLNEPFQSVSLLDAAAADTTLDMWGEPLACDASSLSPPHCRRKYSHSGHAEGRSITELNASSEPIRWSPIHMEASPTTSNWLEHILPTSADLQKGLLGQQLELGRDRDSAEGLVVLTLDDPWRDECNEDDLLMAPLRAPLKHDHATSIKMATENPVEKADVDMVDLCCSPFVNTADRRRFAVTVFEDAAVIDADSENEKDGEDGALSSESDVNEASDPSSSSENLANNSDPAEVYTLSLRERLNAIRNRTVSAGAESSSLFKSAMASCGLDSNDIGIAPASSIAGTEINVRYSNDQRNLSDDSGEPTDMVNVADDYDYFQRVEDYDFWGDDTRVTNLVTEPDIMTFDDDSAPEQSLKSRGILVPLIAGEETLLTAVAPKVSKPKNKKSTAKPAPADASSAVPPDSTYLPVGWEKHWEVVLLVDIREKENATILSNLMDCGVLCETAQLVLGDFLWAARKKGSMLMSETYSAKQQTLVDCSFSVEGKTEESVDGAISGTKAKAKSKKQAVKNPLDEMVILDCIIERKTAADLAASITDGRYKEQSNRLLKCGVRVCSYIIEGLSLSSSSRGGYARGVNAKSLESAMVSMRVKGLDVQRTRGLDHTISLLAAFHLHVCNRFESGRMGESSPNGTLLMTYAKFQRRNAKSAVEMTMLMLLAAQLRQIPNCSEESAKAIARTFGTMNNIMTFVNEVGNVSDTINFISNIRREGEKGRRVGVSLAEYIVKLFSKKPW